jgi:TonB family C-terminal domain
MKRFAILILLLVSAASARAASYEARTPLHAVAIDLVSLGADDVRFDVTIRELPSGQVLTSQQLTAKNGRWADESIDVRETHVHIRVWLLATDLTATVELQQGDDIIDSIHATWSTATRKARVIPEGVLRIGGDVKAPVVIQRIEPVYPEEARKARISGIVILEVIIDRTGAVKDVTVLKPLPFGLSEAAIDAVKQWTFVPGTLNGKPVNVTFNVTMNFKLDAIKPPEPR